MSLWRETTEILCALLQVVIWPLVAWGIISMCCTGCHFHAHIHLPGGVSPALVEIDDEMAQRQQDESGVGPGRTLWDSLDPRGHNGPDSIHGGDGNNSVDRSGSPPRF